MAVNSSSSLYDFQPCSQTAVGVSIVTAFLVTKFLFLTLSFLVFYLGYQRWRQQHSFAKTSHSDIFTYHLAAIELICGLGATLKFLGKYFGRSDVIKLSWYLFSVDIPGETSFHILTCIERYLAVVHPVTYLKLRQSRGVRIRNISIGGVWLLCMGWIGVTDLYYPGPAYIPYFCLSSFALVVTSFCSFSVLCVLIRPGPGDVVLDRSQVDQSKQRAFHTIMAITGVLWVYFLGFLVCAALDNSHVLSYIGECVVLLFGNFVTLPSTLVLPLLFLHRAGKLLF